MCVLVNPRRVRPAPGRIALRQTEQIGFGRGWRLIPGPSVECGQDATPGPSPNLSRAWPGPNGLFRLNLDLFRLDALGLGQAHDQHAIPIRRPYPSGLDRYGQREGSLELPEPPFPAVVAGLLVRLPQGPLALDHQEVASDGHTDVLLAQAGEIDVDDQLVGRLPHVSRRSPGAIHHAG